jgi:hypothetical protein
MSQAEFDSLEGDLLERRRQLRESRQGADPAALSPSDYKITGIDATFEGDEHS